jgi:hypothetical protein
MGSVNMIAVLLLGTELQFHYGYPDANSNSADGSENVQVIICFIVSKRLRTHINLANNEQRVN